MRFIPEESKKEREAREALEDMGVLKSSAEQRAKARKEKQERAQKDWEQKQKTYELKRERLKWQQERSKIKDIERKKADERRRKRAEDGGSSKIEMEPISDKDRDPTAYKKAISGVTSFAGAALGAGAKATLAAARRRKKSKPQQTLKEPQKLLPPGKGPVGALPPRKGPVGRLEPSSGERARRDPGFKKREIEKRGGSVTEEFSCWREEFLYELGEMRRKNKKKDDEDYIVDVMKGKNKITVGPKIKDTGLQEGKRDAATNALLTLAFVANAAQSPKDLVRSGHIESPGIQLMDRMMRKRKDADRNLDSGRVSHPARNIKKKEQVKEALDKGELLKAIVRKLIDEKKRKNTLLTKGYIGEAKYSKENLQCNKPKADPVGDSETGKSHVVKSCEGGTKKLIRFGQRGVKGSPKKKGESKAYANRRKRFKVRHAKNIAKGKMSAAYWANKVKW